MQALFRETASGYLFSLDSSLESVDHHGNNLEQVAADAVVSNFEDGSGVVLVDSDDALGVRHTSLVLDSTGDTQSDVDARTDGFTGLTNLVDSGDPAGVNASTGRTDNAASRSASS